MKRFIAILLISLFTFSQCFAANEWRKGTGENVILGTENAADIDTVSYQNIVAPLDRILANYREGTALSYASASTITVAAGEVVCSNSGGTIRKFRQNTSSTTATWSDIDTGSEAGSTTYYVYAVADTDATTFTVKISTNSATPTGVTYFKRLGSFYNDASSNITQVTNDNNSGDIAYVKGQGNYYKIDSGTVNTVAGTNVAVSFSFTFASAPKVVISHAANGPGLSTNSFLVAQSITTTGFNAYIYETDTACSWIAIGQVLAQ